MSTTTFLDCYTTEGTVDGDVFYRFVQSSLLPHLMPFNGTNPNSVVILDNCSIHHLDDVVDLIHSVGAHVIFLPPYSPDLMPIEQCFDKVKLFLQEHDTVIKSVSDPTMIITAAFASITSEDCIAWSACRLWLYTNYCLTLSYDMYTPQHTLVCTLVNIQTFSGWWSMKI